MVVFQIKVMDQTAGKIMSIAYCMVKMITITWSENLSKTRWSSENKLSLPKIL